MAIRKRIVAFKRSGKKASVYEAEVYVRGVRVAYKVFRSAVAAEAWHEKTKQLYEGEVPEAPKSYTFAECFERFKEERLPQLRGQTQQTYEGRFQYLTESPLMSARMSEITDRTIDLWFAWLRKHPTASDQARKHFRQEFNLLRTILYWYRNCLDSKYVVPIVKRHTKAIHYKVVRARRPDYFMRRTDVQRWIDWLRLHQAPVYGRLATFMVLTATRVGEAAGLCWDAVDLDSEVVTVIRTVWWDYHRKMPNLQECAKTEESVRIIKLSPPVLRLLREMRAETAGDGPVFTREDGSLLRYRGIQHAFNRGFKALGLPWRSTHICRHSFGTLALLASRDLSSVQAAMGHRNIQQTEAYAKVVVLIDGATVTKTAEFILNLKFPSPSFARTP